MPNIKVSQLPDAAALTGDELLLGVQDGASVKIQGSKLAEVPAIVAAIEAAEGEADRAEQEADRAEAARDAAVVQAGDYDTPEDGIAATTDGQYFRVRGTQDGLVAFTEYKNVAGVAVLWNAYPSKKAVDAPKDGNGTTFTRSFTNLVDKSDPGWGTPGYFSGGIIVGTSTHKHTGLIPVSPGEKISYRNSNANAGWFDADGNLIVGQALPISGTGTITVPATVGSPARVPAYISFSATNATFDSLFAGKGEWIPEETLDFGVEDARITNEGMLKQIAAITPTAEIPGELIEPASIDGSKTTWTKGFRNVVDKNDPEWGTPGYFSGGSIVGTDGYKHTGLIPVKPGMKISYRNSNANAGWYDATRTLIVGQALPAPNTGTITVPSTVGSPARVPAYISFSASNATFDQLFAGYGDWIPPEFLPYGDEDVQITNQRLLKQIASPVVAALTGIKWTVFGDSITNNPDSYANIIANRYGIDLTKISADGAHIHHDTDDALILSESLDDVPEGQDLITIAGGTNDGLDTLGTMSDRTTATFYGALHVMASTLMEEHPSAKIAFFTPLPRLYHGGAPQAIRANAALKAKAIREVAAYYALPVLDLFTNANGLDPNIAARRTLRMPDGLHPNADGHQWYADVVEQFLARLV